MKENGKKLLVVTLLLSLICSNLLSAVPGGTVKAAETDEWEYVSDIVSRYYGEWTDNSYTGVISNQMPQSAMLGNGDIGIASYGSDLEKTYLISKGDFWSYNGSPLPVGGVTIRKVRNEPEEKEENGNFANEYKSVSASSTHESYYPSRAVDGKIGLQDEGWVSAVQTSTVPWLMLEFEEEVIIGRYVVVGDGGIRPNTGNNGNNPKEFRLQVSDNGINWRDVDHVEDNTLSVVDRNLEEQASGKFVRLYLDIPNQQASSDQRNNPRGRVGIFQLYEDPVSEEESYHGDADASRVLRNDTSRFDDEFYEKQDILNAEIQTELTFEGVPFEINTWLSASENLLVTEIMQTSEDRVDVEIETWAKSDNGGYPASRRQMDGELYLSRKTRSTNDTNGYVSEAVMTTRVFDAEVLGLEEEGNAAAVTAVRLEPGQKAYIVTAIEGGAQTYDYQGNLNGDDPWLVTKELIETITGSAHIEEVKEVSQEWWKDYWCTSYLDFGVEDEKLDRVQSYYYGAQYILGSGLRKDGMAGGLYGIWHTNDTPSWNSDFHLNYNFISSYYGLNSNNRSELTWPAIQAILDYLPTGAAKASSTAEIKRIYSSFVEMKVEKGDIHPENGIEGAILYPVGIGPYGMTLDNGYHNEALNAGYSAYPFLEYYDYTLDEEFLEDILYDYLKKCMRLYEVWLEKEEREDGYEYILYAGYNEGSWSQNPAVELAVVKNLLVHLIKFSKQLGIDADKRILWEDIYNNLHEQPTMIYNGKEVLTLAELEYRNGTWGELSSPIPGDGNAIPLDSVIPGNVYNHFSPREELQVIHNTIDVFAQRGGWGAINNFPRLFPIAAECGYDPQEIIDQFVNQLGRLQKNNLFIYDNIHGFEKAGSIETFNQMMLNSEEGYIKVFPNWLEEKNALFNGFRAKGAFIVSSQYKDGAVQDIEITSEKGAEAKVVIPWENAEVIGEDGQKVEMTFADVMNSEDKAVQFMTEAGKSYTVKQADPVDPGEGADKTMLEITVAYAESLILHEHLIPIIRRYFEEALANAQAVLLDETADQEIVDAADEWLMKIIGYLAFTADPTGLQDAIDYAEELIDSGLYQDDEAMDNYKDALEKAKEILEAEDSMEEDFNKAVQDLLEAEQELNEKAQLKLEALRKEVEASRLINLELYLDLNDTKENFRTALETAQDLLANPTNQSAVDAAAIQLRYARLALRLIPDKSMLEDLILEAEGISFGQYTQETVAVLQAALANARIVFNNPAAIQDEVDEAYIVLKQAIEGLKEKGPNQTDSEDTEDTSDTKGTEDTKDTGDTKGTDDTRDTGDTKDTDDTKDTGDSKDTKDTDVSTNESQRGKNSKSGNNSGKIAKTGDMNNIIIIMVGILTAGSILFFSIVQKRRINKK